MEEVVRTRKVIKRELFGYGHLNRYRQRCGGWRRGRFINSTNAKPSGNQFLRFFRRLPVVPAKRISVAI
jgi:hypothetical protein